MIDNQKNYGSFQNTNLLAFEDREMLKGCAHDLGALHFQDAARRFYWWLSSEGWRFSPLRFYDRILDRRFDRTHGVDTAGIVDLPALDFFSRNKDKGVYYQASGVTLVRRILKTLPINHADYSFVDVGAGKGRVVLVASEFPFRRVLGVEFAPALVEVARQNIAHYTPRLCRDTSVVCCDATEVDLPDDNLVLYFYNPFSREIMEAVAARILDASNKHGKKIMVIYHIPAYHDILDNMPIFGARKQFHKTTIYYPAE